MDNKKNLYTEEELKGMSENRKRINNLSNVEIMREWETVTAKIRKKYGIKEKGE